jgi:aldose 1-epimerase
MSTHQYALARETQNGTPVIVLRDDTAHEEARVATAAGNNCFQFRVHAGERPLELLAGPLDAAALPKGGSGFGVPILFPFPNRVRAARYRFQGYEYTLDANSGENHIHGMVMSRAWQVESTGASPETGAWVRSTIRAGDYPEIHRQYPFPFQLSVQHTLKEGVLRIDALVENTGPGDLPMGFGLHPWFPAPLVPEGKREAVEVQVPAGRVWELDAMLPTGRLLPAEGKFALRRLTALGTNEYDDVLTAIETHAGASECVMRDPACPVDIVVGADAGFREWVLFAPHRRATVCLEPYTCATDAVNLQERGVDAGLIVLGPGKRWSGSVTIGTRPRPLPRS